MAGYFVASSPKILPIVVRGTCLLLTAFLVLIVIGLWSYHHSARDRGKHAPGAIRTVPAEVTAGTQLEDHTCGFLALSTVYRSHGIDPEAANVRFRLGTDMESNPFDPTTRGSLHPDLLRVISQDGFCYAFADPGDQGALLQHLQEFRCAMLLVVRQSSGGLHWVVATADGDTIKILDSLEVSPQGYDSEQVLSALLLTHSPGSVSSETTGAHRDGLAEMARVAKRLATRRTGGARLFGEPEDPTT